MELDIHLEFVFQVHVEWTTDLEMDFEIFGWEFENIVDPEITEGPNGNAICLEGPQFIRIEADESECFGSWEVCADSGVTFSTSIKLDHLLDDTYLFSSGVENGDMGFALFYSFWEFHVGLIENMNQSIHTFIRHTYMFRSNHMYYCTAACVHDGRTMGHDILRRSDTNGHMDSFGYLMETRDWFDILCG